MKILILSLLFSTSLLATDYTKSGKVCIKKIGPAIRTSYIGLVKQNGKLVTAIRTETVYDIEGQKMDAGTALVFDDGDANYTNVWNKGMLMKPVKSTTTYGPNELASFITTAHYVYGPCSDWKVDPAKLTLPTAGELNKAAQ